MPLGFPLLAGPASISSVIVEMRHGAGGVRDLRDIGVTRFDVENAARVGHGSGVAHGAMIVTRVLAVCATAWVVLRAAHPIRGYLGRRGISALSRFFAFLLAAIAVEIISAGLRSLFPALG